MSVKYPTYVNLTSSSEEQPNERTPSPPPKKKSLSPPQAPSKSICSKSTHYTSSSSPRILVNVVQQRLQRELELQLSMSKAFKAKVNVEREAKGDHIFQCVILTDYVVEL
ncbi:hypothetical protein Tco_0609161 [Tanacetum coccineum]